VPKITVDLEKCTGCETCASVCPVGVFEIQELAEYGGQKKAVVVNQDACILCRACESQCPEQCITVEE